MGRIPALFLTAVLAALPSARPAIAQGLIERCDPALAAAEEMGRYVVDCSAALSSGGFSARAASEEKLVERLRSYNAAAVYMAGDPDPCAKLVAAKSPEESALCRVYFTGLQGRAAACKKLPPVYGALCRDGEAYLRASKAGNAEPCGPSRRCRLLMGAPDAAAPKLEAGHKGFSCVEPLHSAANRKALTDALTAVELCLRDTETVVPLAGAAVAQALDDRAERLARLRLQLKAYFAGPPVKKTEPARAR